MYRNCPFLKIIGKVIVVESGGYFEGYGEQPRQNRSCVQNKIICRQGSKVVLTHGGFHTKLFFEEPAEVPNLKSLPSFGLSYGKVPTQFFEWFSWPSFMSLPDDPHQNKKQLHSDSLDKAASAPPTTSNADVHIYNDNDILLFIVMVIIIVMRQFPWQ